MRKVLQSVTVLGIFCFLSTAAMHAETMGTNPRPRPAVMAPMIAEVITAMTVFLAAI